MAITNKGSRRIVVDATPYRWIVRPRHALRQGWSPAQRAGVFELTIRLAPASPAPHAAPG